MRRLILLIAGVALATAAAFGQSVTSDVVGFTTTSLLGNSDTYVATPFTRVPAFVGAISATTASTITVSGAPWIDSPPQFVYGGTQHNHYYVLMGPIAGSNTKEGRTYAITGNTSNSLTVATTAGNDVSGIPANTQITIIPNWTPATLFPPSEANVSFTPTTSPPTYKTLLRAPNYSASGINLPYAAEYYYVNGGWQRISPAGLGDDDPLTPDGYFVVRNTNGAPTLPLTNIGSVLTKKISTPLIAAANPGQDNALGLVRPLDLPLNATGLSAAFGANDRLLLFDNSVAGFDKSPSAIYSFDTRWRLTGDATLADRGSDAIPMGTGFVVRKIGGASTFWTNAFPVTAASAASRKNHNGTALDVNLPVTTKAGTVPGVESRVAGSTLAGAGVDHQIVVTFPAAVTFSSASVSSGPGNVASVSGNGTGAVTINLSGVIDGQLVTVTLAGVNDGSNVNDIAIRMGVLVGDTTGDGAVNSADITQAKSMSGQPVSASNSRVDVTVDGNLNSADISIVKGKSGTALPGS